MLHLDLSKLNGSSLNFPSIHNAPFKCKRAEILFHKIVFFVRSTEIRKKLKSF
jgi:hypothetical protein